MLSNTSLNPANDKSRSASATRQAAKPRKSAQSRRFRSRPLAVLGLLFVSFLCGAATMFFELPSSGLIAKAFLGGRAWTEQIKLSAQDKAHPSIAAKGACLDEPGKTFDGFTLFTHLDPSSSTNTNVFLVNMKREVVHRWACSFQDIWPNPEHVPGWTGRLPACIFGGHLYPNGDLLVIFHGMQQQIEGFGLAKLDREANVLWKYSANVHHDVDVAEDGTIYLLTHGTVHERPAGMNSLPLPMRVDYLVALSPEGKELGEPISILDALCESPYAPLLSLSETTKIGDLSPGVNLRQMSNILESGDIFHANSVRVLTKKLAPHFPSFKAGQILVSLRNIHVLALFDVKTRSVVWATTGPWRFQHDADFLENGHLLMLDNRGSLHNSRVLEYDPVTQTFPWCYAGENRTSFLTPTRGMSQRLPNGNTLIALSETGEIVEVSQTKEVVWSYVMGGFVPWARRYSADQLHFLKEGQQPRP
jgi:hypothetical protein